MFHCKQKLVILSTLIGLCSLHASTQAMDPVQHKQRHLKIDRVQKFENGLVISWLINSDDPGMDQIQLSDAQGKQLAALRVLRLVPDAASVTIYDVSAQPRQMIAVAAVFRSKNPTFPRPADTLITFDSDGHLRGVSALDPSREIMRLELDESSRIWTLTTHSDERDPATIPLIVEYDAAGNVINELLTRSQFPPHASILRESEKVGPIASGYYAGVVWFWFPESSDLLTIRVSSESVARTKTLLPEDGLIPLGIFRKDSGDLIGEFRLDHAPGTKSETLYYDWSAVKGVWTRFNRVGCENHRLAGVDGKTEIYVHPDTNDVCRKVR
jgi:hypothetical protein